MAFSDNQRSKMNTSLSKLHGVITTVTEMCCVVMETTWVFKKEKP